MANAQTSNRWEGCATDTDTQWIDQELKKFSSEQLTCLLKHIELYEMVQFKQVVVIPERCPEQPIAQSKNEGNAQSELLRGKENTDGSILIPPVKTTDGKSDFAMFSKTELACLRVYRDRLIDGKK